MYHDAAYRRQGSVVRSRDHAGENPLSAGIQREMGDLIQPSVRFYGDMHVGIRSARAIICYPAQLGRNFDELKRVLIGLQTVDKYKVSLPADRRPGEEIVVPAPTTYDGTEQSASCCSATSTETTPPTQYPAPTGENPYERFISEEYKLLINRN